MIIDIVHINDFQDKIKTGFCLVDFWAPWCGPCRMLSSSLMEVNQDMGEKVRIVKVNVDEAADLSSQFNIQSIPALMLFKDAILIGQKTGFLSKISITKWFRESGVEL